MLNKTNNSETQNEFQVDEDMTKDPEKISNGFNNFFLILLKICQTHQALLQLTIVLT